MLLVVVVVAWWWWGWWWWWWGGGGILSRTWCDNMDLVRVWIWLGSKWITRLEALYDTLALGPADPRRAASIAHSRPGSC